MKKRDFLWATAIGAAALPAHAAAQQVPKSLKGPAILTVSGLIGKGNRGALDPALDQMMVKQKIKFDKAHAFDFASLAAMPAVTIKPTLEYDGKVHTLRGPLLANVARAAGAPEGSRLLLRAVDGYSVVLPLGDAVKYRYIVATHLDGHPMPLGGLGPVWAVYEADQFADMMAKSIADRFALCPWGMYHMEVQPS
ncbi:MAG: molybdopterin-dependent oxidoreductase [Rhodoferax sp.]|nr:molybdopterin-dependent oxidoreductase [Rhodoferax sp.]